MATATRKLVGFPTEFGEIEVRLEYDDALLRATSVVCDNPSPNNVSVVVTRDSDGREYARVCGPGSSRLNIPTNPAGRLTLVPNSRGGFDGCSFGGAYPA